MPGWSSPMPAELVSEHQAPYIERFERTAKAGPRWLQETREAAIESFAELGFPNSHDEDWKFTNLNPLLRKQFEPAEAGHASAAAELLSRFPANERRIVLLNGRYQAALSN